MDYETLADSLDIAVETFERLSKVLKNAAKDELQDNIIKGNIQTRLDDITEELD